MQCATEASGQWMVGSEQSGRAQTREGRRWELLRQEGRQEGRRAGGQQAGGQWKSQDSVHRKEQRGEAVVLESELTGAAGRRRRTWRQL